MKLINQGPNINDMLLPLSLFLVTVASRLPFTSKLLYHTDSVHFALALEKYDITTHQPHPPGYFLYVMLGRLLNLFIGDANTVFVIISIIFSGLTVVAIYYLGKEMFDRKTGIIAALFAIASPNMWFHGEVALTYIVEAFFSTLIAFLCWKIYKGEHKYLYFSVVALAIAGGIRQNSIIFLLPLWFFSIKGLPVRKIVTAFILLGVICLFWFVPMIWMTGGYGIYKEAFRELWLFNTGYNSVFEKGLPRMKLFSSALFSFSVYGLGSGVVVLFLSVYSIIRHKRLPSLDRSKAIFFVLWILPSVMFYLFIFIHPANPGYALIFIPALLILAAVSVVYIADELRRFTKIDFSGMIVMVLIIVNVYFFFFSNYPVSYREINNHDKDLAIMLTEIKTFDPSKTAIFLLPDIFYGYRQIMYYLPEYRVYDVAHRVSKAGEVRKNIWGVNRKTFWADEIDVSEGIDSFISVLISKEKDEAKDIKGIFIKELRSTNLYIASGDIALIRNIFPKFRIKLH